jgi:hypothetical protein
LPLILPVKPHQILRAAQLLSCAAAAVSTVKLGQLGGRLRGLSLALPALAFFCAAFTTRFILQETESRLQIAAFAAAALLLEQLRSRSLGDRYGLGRMALNGAAGMVGVLCAKHILEPGAISLFVQQLFDGSS